MSNICLKCQSERICCAVHTLCEDCDRCLDFGCYALPVAIELGNGSRPARAAEWAISRGIKSFQKMGDAPSIGGVK